MNDKLRKLIRLIIILVGIGVLVYPSLSEYLMQRNASHAVALYDDTVSKMNQAEIDSMLEDAREYNRFLASSTGGGKPPVDSKGNPISLDSYHQMLNVNDEGMMGYITIPKINVTCRIFHGIDESVLQVGIGHLQNTSLPVGGETTHAVLSGHRGLPTADLFTNLDKLTEGDEFYIKVLNQTLCYEVDQIVVVLPDETEELAIQKGKDYVTLVTCTPYGVNSHRLLVRGKRVPFEEDDVPVYDNADLGSFWSRLPTQYKHMLMGAGVLVVFLLIWNGVKIIKKRVKKHYANTIEERGGPDG